MKPMMSALSPSKEICQVLGEMCIRFQDVENAVKGLGHTLSADDDIKNTHFRYAYIHFGNLLDDVRKRADGKRRAGLQWFSEFDRVMRALEGVSKRRNELIHSTWSCCRVTGAGQRKKRVRIGSKAAVVSEVVTVRTLQRFNKKLESLMVRVVALLDDKTLGRIIDEDF